MDRDHTDTLTVEYGTALLLTTTSWGQCALLQPLSCHRPGEGTQNG